MIEVSEEIHFAVDSTFLKPPQVESGDHAKPDRPLGGPFTGHTTRKSNVTRVSEAESVKLELDQLAGLLARSRNRFALIGPYPQMLQNVITAAQKLAKLE
ncbi:hypothetical protein [Deinococcus peraridilitoris]|uniref:Uncharacterized protein n=1 Tax=Deinococcus peraridilitoris (strain DSM 19664 / LMG 22246 / CIP 109416 / KR-200) TaxID=937777 RepID=L0A896_DEIPD|nr:hypothetical protein [Deinococcus peraridilitoris]AFZ69295.1 hypothetical protein Deipe_3880 [Deinococcus peraridilitoris DSM 19664]